MKYIAFLAFALTSCGSGGSPAAVDPVGAGFMGAPAAPQIPTSFDTPGHVFGVRNFTLGPVTLVTVTTGSDEVDYVVALPAGSDLLLPDVPAGPLTVRLFRADGWQFARHFTYVPGASDGVIVTKGDLDIDATFGAMLP